MVHTFLNRNFLSNMFEILSEKNISEVSDLNLVNFTKLDKTIVLNGFSSMDFLYLFEAISKKLREKGLEIKASNIVPIMLKEQNKTFYYFIKKEENTYTLYGRTHQSVSLFANKCIYGAKGLIKSFDKKNKETIDKSFDEGKLSFINYYKIQLQGIYNLEEIIEKQRKDIINSYKIGPFGKCSDEEIKNLVSTFEMTMEGNCNFLYTTYVMTVFSFIEHVALLTTSFWYASRNNSSYWNSFCNTMDNRIFNSYKEFWTSKNINLVKSFIYTICNYYQKERESFFKTDATKKEKELKFLYDRLRRDYRNPIHHGFAIGEDKTGLSMEVPSLNKRVLFNMAPMLGEIDSKAYTDTKQLLELFLDVFKNNNHEICTYLEIGLNVPVDCTELSEYIENNDINSFIEQYSMIEEHYEEIIESQIDACCRK